MLRNYLTTAFLNFRKNKGYTFISISGLSVGLASCILILLWVRDEAGMDNFHANGDRIYQVWRNMVQASGRVNTTSGIPIEKVTKSMGPKSPFNYGFLDTEYEAL